MKQPTILSLALIAALSAGAVVAATPPMARGTSHAKLDTNGDGVIDRSEAAARPRLAARFDQIDVNHDGRIDASERPKHGEHGEGAHGMARLDTNHDGVIDRTEAAAFPRLAERFDQLDLNHDGRIDASERPKHGEHGEGGHGMARLDTNHDGVIDRAEAAANPRLAQRFDQLDRNHDGRIDASERPMHGDRDGKGGRGGMLARLDADHDGRLSRAEVGSSPMASHFDQVDTNHDGFIDKAEGQQAMRRWRAEHDKDGPSTQNGVGSGGTGHH